MNKNANRKLTLPKTIPKHLLKSRSRCRRKMYRLIRSVENIYIMRNYDRYRNKRERDKIRAYVYLFLSTEINCSISQLQFKTMGSNESRRLSILLDKITAGDIVYWIDKQNLEDYKEQIKTILNGE